MRCQTISVAMHMDIEVINPQFGYTMVFSAVNHVSRDFAHRCLPHHPTTLILSVPDEQKRWPIKPEKIC